MYMDFTAVYTTERKQDDAHLIIQSINLNLLSVKTFGINVFKLMYKQRCDQKTNTVVKALNRFQQNKQTSEW